ncbi:class II DAHP synthetase [Dichotomopilus funicola]|uniref:Phospho-2-dehydro-3-deoxyheptonate aldolase n=1 Tax=Dichotomopilus funicola TaxID=1934379 RepID=A0AAN6UZ16_9PEZI|nr:class II DAHP synthetase [Dichotomopilus funicola]
MHPSTDIPLTQRRAWSPTSWQSSPTHAQQVLYPPHTHPLLAITLARLADLPPLVNPSTIDTVRSNHAAAARGEAFLLVGGDCAESFDDTTDAIVGLKMDLLNRQAEVLERALGEKVPVHVTARLAGQYSKPRSQLMETLVDGRTVHAFRGHNVNGASAEDREPDPRKLLHGWWHALAVLHKLSSSLMNTDKKQRKPIYTAHEALHLPLETALTTPTTRYNTSAAFLWIGERTRQLDGAHLEYARGLRNPVGVKIGPTTTPEEVIAVLTLLSGPLDSKEGEERGEEGKVTLIPRLGVDKASIVLPPILRAIQASGLPAPVWMCDPCHGNTFAVDTGPENNGAVVKTRCPTTMLREVEQVIEVLGEFGVQLGGLHLEQTGEDVVECVDKGVLFLSSSSSSERYKSLCDPRLSGSQALEFVEKVAEMLVKARAMGEETEKQGVVEDEKVVGGVREGQTSLIRVPLLERALRFFRVPFAGLLGNA